MFHKLIYTIWPAIRIYFLFFMVCVLFVPGPASAQSEFSEDPLLPFSGQKELKEALWRLAAFVPGSEESASLTRTLSVEGVSGLPTVTIELGFEAALDLWPESLTLNFMAEESAAVPVFFTITDRRPFGGPNLLLTGLDRKSDSRPSEVILQDLLNGLNQRLLAGQERLGPVKWREVAPGFEMARARLLYGVRLGTRDLFLARFVPDLYAFRPYHENEYPKESQTDIQGWSLRLDKALALINGGQYYPDRSYMGVLTREGRDLSPKAHTRWKGFLVSAPATGAPEGTPKAAIIDQNYTSTLEPGHYLNVLQSYMLLDEKGIIRVRDSFNLAGRAAIGQDKAGRLVFIMTPGAISLYDLALALKGSSLELVRVMGLDGGFEAQLLLRENGHPFLSGGRFSITRNKAIYLPGFYQSLPTVLAVEPFGGDKTLQGDTTLEETPPIVKN